MKHGDYEENGKYENPFDYGKLKRAWTVPRRIVLAMFLILLPLDYLLELGICKEVMAQDPAHSIAGVVILLLFCFIIGRHSPHRTFTHSILYILLFSTGIYFISPMMALPALVGGFSHLMLDVLNNEGIRIFYPFKWKICLHKLQPDKTANTVFMWAGLGADILLISLFVMTSILPVLA